ncbi:hypothetical protein [Shewanella donghaensis]|uniref:hypothetical protein n=1 Tax=Shewanella donghaensis TaxID=238836 RepID=UPI00221F084F|nr:hypothetical protein [Shewanella donghaensis]
MSLAAPPLVRTIESSQARSEEIRLVSRLKVYSAKAFVNEKNVVLLFDGKTLKVKLSNKIENSYLFEHISFPKQQIIFGPLGFANKEKLLLRAGKNERIISINEKAS